MSQRVRLVVVTILVVVVGAGVVVAPALAPDEESDETTATPVDDEPGAEITAGDTGTDVGDAEADSTTRGTDGETTEGNDTTAEATRQTLSLSALIEPCAARPPDSFADPDENVIGWADGVWYNESLSINTTGGVTLEQLQRLAARATARIEAMRCLDATDGAPEVTVESRSEFRDDQTGDTVASSEQQFENARLETLLLVSQEQDAVEQQGETRADSVAAFYSPFFDEITLITNDSEEIVVDESTLAHELGHAIQDQQFGLENFDGETTDAVRGERGLLEGDVTRLERQYRRGCVSDVWGESCLGVGGPPSDGDGNGSVDPEEGTAPDGPPNWGLYFLSFQPYNDGPAFVDQLYEVGGWDAVNDRYENPPESVLPIARPGTETVALTNVTVPDRSTDGWDRLSRRGPDYDSLGIAGISAMFLAPSFESRFEENIYPPQSVLNTGPDGEVDAFNPVNYWHPETEGWRGDRLYTYTNNESQRATVWQLAWAGERDRELFVDAYVELIEYRGGEQVDDEELTYRFGADSEFDMAVSIRPDGDTVTLVTAPTVEQLQAVHGG